MQLLKGQVDVAILPIGDNYTMGPDDAVRAIEFIEPQGGGSHALRDLRSRSSRTRRPSGPWWATGPGWRSLEARGVLDLVEIGGL
jgi:hypothetical protein